MKRALLWLLVALLAGTAAGQLMIEDPGYLMLVWKTYVIETSVWIAGAGMLVLFLLALAAAGLLGTLIDAGDALQRWRANRRARRALDLVQAGLAQYAGADWRKATSTLLKAAELVDSPLLVRLQAARAAELDGRMDLAEQVLRESRGSAGDALPLVDEALAGLKLRHGDAASARFLLERVRAQHPGHPRALPLLAGALEQLDAWKALTELLPALRKVMPEVEWQALMRRAWCGHLTQVAGEPGYASRKARIEALQHAWKAIPAEYRADETVVATCASLFVKHEAVSDAHATLEKAINNSWSDTLAAHFGRLDAGKPAEQLAAIEKWLATHPTNASLLLAAGRASLRNKLWGKARDYFEASAARQATPEVCAELVRLYSRLGETARADQFLRRHIELTGSELPKLPLPTARV
ncbi:MAG: heme biosynthesis HemY N-terminal domain-containing protein [Gammaproteobacteria bacterium]